MKRKIALLGLFLSLETIMVLLSRHPITFELTVLIALPFASSMAARAIAYLDIFEWLRAPFTVITPHSSGAGNSVEPKNGSVIGGLLSCINCAGMWSTVGLLGLYILEPALGRLMIYALGATGLGVLVTRSIETIEWKGHLAHEQAGYANRYNKGEVTHSFEDALFDRYVKVGPDISRR